MLSKREIDERLVTSLYYKSSAFIKNSRERLNREYQANVGVNIRPHKRYPYIGSDFL